MKKFYFIILAVFITSLSSCSSDDNGSSNSNIQINPPNWIQGKWLIDNTIMDMGFRFTSNDIITIQASAESSQRGYIKQFTDAGQDVSTSEEMDENSYSIIFNYPFGQSVTYSFTRISDTEISWDAVNNSVYIKQ